MKTIQLVPRMKKMHWVYYMLSADPSVGTSSIAWLLFVQKKPKQLPLTSQNYLITHERMLTPYAVDQIAWVLSKQSAHFCIV